MKQIILLNSDKELAFLELLRYGPTLKQKVEFSKRNRVIINKILYVCKQ